MRCREPCDEGKVPKTAQNKGFWAGIRFSGEQMGLLTKTGRPVGRPDEMAPAAGLEPATYGLTVHRSTN